MISKAIKQVASVFGGAGSRAEQPPVISTTPKALVPETPEQYANQSIGIIAGNGSFPLRFAAEARAYGCKTVAVCHTGETLPEIAAAVDRAVWIKVGELGKLIRTFKDEGIRYVAMAGGINRVNLFGGVKVDARGAALLLRLRSMKDDVLMRGIAEELGREGVQVIDCTVFLRNCLARTGVITKSRPTDDELNDIEVGKRAIEAMSAQDIGQTVVVREGVVVAVEAVEGTDRAILRGGELGGAGSVVIKFAKPTQDMRFDVPTVGVKTLQTMIEAKARVLALEAGRCLLLDEAEVVALADKHKIAIVGCESLI